MTDQEKETLTQLIAKHKTSQAKALRARIILQFHEGKAINSIAKALGVVYNTPYVPGVLALKSINPVPDVMLNPAGVDVNVPPAVPVIVGVGSVSA